MSKKKCIDCEEILELKLSNFYTVKQRKDGFDNKCRKCRNAYHRLQKAKTQGKQRKKIKQSKIDSKTSICKSCGIEKPKTSEFFYKNPKTIDGFSNVCTKCKNIRISRYNKEPINRGKARNRIHSKKVSLLVYKGSVCKICGLTYNGVNAAVFDFHHINEDSKSFSIASSMFKSLQNLYVEVDKCILLCSNCHREVHSSPY